MDFSTAADHVKKGSRQAERLVRFCCSVWKRKRSPFTTLAEVKKFLDQMLQLFVSEKRAVSLNSIFGMAYPWITPRCEVPSRIVRPPNYIRNAFEGIWPQITVKSADRSWMASVTQAGTAEWSRSGNMLSTWIALGRAADEVNKWIMTGEEAASICYCDDVPISYHPC